MHWITAELLQFHLGPGPHPDGTPQSIHGGQKAGGPAAKPPAPKSGGASEPARLMNEWVFDKTPKGWWVGMGQKRGDQDLVIHRTGKKYDYSLIQAAGGREYYLMVHKKDGQDVARRPLKHPRQGLTAAEQIDRGALAP